MRESPPALEVAGLTKDYGPRRVLSSVSFSVAAGQTTAVIGPSGSGKSTLLRCIVGLERPDGGKVLIDGKDHAAIDSYWFRSNPAARAVGMVFQDYNLWTTMTALDNLSLPLTRVAGLAPAEAHARAEAAARKFGLQDLLERMPGQLSGGEKQRFALLRAVLLQPRVILLDEVTAALDVETRWTVLQMLWQLASEGTTMLLVSHELPFVRRVADRTVFMKNGELVEEGPTGRLLTSPDSDSLRTFLQRLELPGREAATEAASGAAG